MMKLCLLSMLILSSTRVLWSLASFIWKNYQVQLVSLLFTAVSIPYFWVDHKNCCCFCKNMSILSLERLISLQDL